MGAMLIPLLLAAMVLGGLINLLADSLPYTRRPQPPHCLACGAPFPPAAWFAFSAILTRNWRCGYCDSRRSWRALIVELGSLLIAVSLTVREPYMATVWTALIIASVYLLIVVIDIEHRLILHIVSVASASLIVLLAFVDPKMDVGKSLLGGVVGLLLVFALFLLGGLFGRYVASRQDDEFDEVAFGFGDVTLAGVIGLSVGFPGVFVALFIGILVAGEFSMVYILDSYLRGRYQAFLPIPYGPFLVIGAWTIFFGGPAAIEFIFPLGPLFLLAFLLILFAVRYFLDRLRA